MALGMADWHLTKFKSYDVSFLVFGFSKTDKFKCALNTGFHKILFYEPTPSWHCLLDY